MGAARVRSASAKGIFGAGDENAGAARLAPDALVVRPRRPVIVLARQELARVDAELAIQEMQLFDARMGYGRDNARRAQGVPAC
jgi:hypothetical protein